MVCPPKELETGPRRCGGGIVRGCGGGVKIGKHIEEVVNGGNLAVVDNYIAPTYVRHDPGLPFDVQGPDGVRELVTVYRTAFSDIHFDRQALVGDRDRVAVYWTIRGPTKGS